MNEPDFDRALGAWEDNQLNAHLAGEVEWDDAYTKGEDVVWESTLKELYDRAPVGVERKIEEVVEIMAEHVAQRIMDGGA